MARDEEEPKKRKGLNLFSPKALLVFLLVFGLAFGALFEHQFVEPRLNDSAKKLAACESTNALLNQENIDCYKEAADLNKQLLSVGLS